MKGCRPLTDVEDRAIFSAYSGHTAVRDRCMHALCTRTGLRITEASSIRVCDVVKNGEVVKTLYIGRMSTKGKAHAAHFELTLDARMAIYEQVRWLYDNGYSWPDCYLLKSSRGINRPLSRSGALLRLHAAAERAGVSTDKLGTHSYRKTFSRYIERWGLERLRAGAAMHPYELLRLALRHRCLQSTMSYVSGHNQYLSQAIHSQPRLTLA